MIAERRCGHRSQARRRHHTEHLPGQGGGTSVGPVVHPAGRHVAKNEVIELAEPALPSLLPLRGKSEPDSALWQSRQDTTGPTEKTTLKKIERLLLKRMFPNMSR